MSYPGKTIGIHVARPHSHTVNDFDVLSSVTPEVERSGFT